MFCRNCGNELQDGARFCDKCGVQQTELLPQAPQKEIVNTYHSKNLKTNIIKAVIFLAVGIGAINVIPKIYEKMEEIFSTELGQSNLLGNSNCLEISNISADTGAGSVDITFKNNSDKVIAYVTFETYYYDRMGNTDDEDYDNLQYTGPMYPGQSETIHWSWLFSMDSDTAAVWPKRIVVTFEDGSEETFKNNTFAASDDLYVDKLN